MTPTALVPPREPPNIPPRQNPIYADHVKTIRPDAIVAPTVIRDEKTTLDARQLRKLFRQETAKDFVGTITPGFHLFGLSKGQFSLVDVIREVSNQTGPCHFSLSTWTVAHADLTELQELLTKDRFLSLRFLFDFSFQRRKPEIIAHVRETFGSASVVVTWNHCKFVTFKNDAWSIVCRTSMNLNFNKRIEDVELKDDPHLYSFFAGFLDEMFSKHESKIQARQNSAAVSKSFNAF